MIINVTGNERIKEKRFIYKISHVMTIQSYHATDCEMDLMHLWLSFESLSVSMMQATQRTSLMDIITKEEIIIVDNYLDNGGQ